MTVLERDTESFEDLFGVCPQCRRVDGYLNIDRGHRGYCERHRVTWFIGANLFADWRWEQEDTWRKNHAKLAAYAEVEPASGRC